MTDYTKMVDLLRQVPRCVFIAERANPKLRVPMYNETPAVHPKFITSIGPKRFRWQFRDPDEDIDYKGSVLWRTAVFAGVYTPLVQYAFPCAITLPFRYDTDRGMAQLLQTKLPELRKAGIGPFFVHNTLVRKGAIQRPEFNKDAAKVIDKIAFPDEVSAIVAQGLLHPSVRLHD